MPPRGKVAVKKLAAKAPIASVPHKDERTNIPTQELRDFVTEDEAKPKSILCPRDPSSDPQLVWKGKGEQDLRDLAVPAVPACIGERIRPQAIVEDRGRFRPFDCADGAVVQGRASRAAT